MSGGKLAIVTGSAPRHRLRHSLPAGAKWGTRSDCGHRRRAGPSRGERIDGITQFERLDVCSEADWQALAERAWNDLTAGSTCWSTMLDLPDQADSQNDKEELADILAVKYAGCSSA